MGYRNLFIANAKRISVKNRQLLIDDVSVPVEDICSLMIENQSTLFSAFVLQYLAELFRLVNYDMEVGNQKQIVSNAIELFVESYSKSLRDNAESITPPVLIALKEHSYE